MTPKMTMAPGEYITPAFRAEMDKWLESFFGYIDDVHQPAMNDANLVAKSTEKRVSNRKTKTQVQPDNQTLEYLLNGLKDSFDTMRIPVIKGSWLERREVNALKKLGTYVPNKFELSYPDLPSVPPGTAKPTIASAYFLSKKHDNDGKIHPRFVFAIKQPRMPHSVEAVAGVPYKFGMCFEMSQDDKGKAISPKLFWAWCWIVITEGGVLKIPKELRQVQAEILHHKNRIRGCKSSTVFNRAWSLPVLAQAEPGEDQSIREKTMTCIFRQLLIWWGGRDQQWSVGVRKNGHRVTFSIDPRHTSAYFADRDIVVNVEGKPKKIIHFVREHTRSNGSHVKSHVRGLREFDWNGYHCTVTAPKLNGFLTAGFDITPVEVERTDIGQDVIEIDALAEKLAGYEDSYRRGK